MKQNTQLAERIVAAINERLWAIGMEAIPLSCYPIVERELAQGLADKAEMEKQYNELLYAVARKHDGETRHQTALRYILEREEVKAHESVSATPTPPTPHETRKFQRGGLHASSPLFPSAV